MRPFDAFLIQALCDRLWRDTLLVLGKDPSNDAGFLKNDFSLAFSISPFSRMRLTR